MWEQSIGKLCKQGRKWSGIEYEKEKKKLGKRRAVRDITPLLTSFRYRQSSTAHPQQRSDRSQS